MELKNSVVVCECGWIVCGKIDRETDRDVCMTGACIVRSWNNGRGIGGLAKEVYKDEYTLDEIGDISICRNKVIFVIPCEW